MGREPTTEEVQAVSERQLTARPTLTDADRDRAEERLGVDEADHRAAGKADALDPGTSGGEADAEALRERGAEDRRRSS